MNATLLRHRLLPRTLFGRSLLIIAVPILLLQGIVAFVFFDRHWDSISNKLVSALTGEIEYVVRELQRSDGPQTVQAIIADASRSLGMTVAVRPAAASHEIPRREDSLRRRVSWFSVSGKLEGKLHNLKVPYAVKPYEKEKWFIIEVEYKPAQIASFLIHERRLVTSTTYIFILWLMGSAFILFVISILFMRNQIRPILRLAVAAEKLGKGQDVPDFRPVGATEVRKAAEAFLLMRDRLRRQMEQRTLMLAGVSHDLRTPLTRMKLQLALAPAGQDTDNLRQDVDEMEKMIEGYLAFAKGEGDEVSVMADLGAIALRIAANAGRAGHNVQTELPDGADRLMLRIRPIAVERALANIVGNACRFAQNVWLAASDGAEYAVVTVDDDGPGIPPAQREEVFRPFYRMEKSRNKKTGGVGLGLSIAQDIVHGHGGEIELSDSPRGGLRVTLRLPR